MSINPIVLSARFARRISAGRAKGGALNVRVADALSKPISPSTLFDAGHRI
jgi:hypothetical protein